MTSKKNVGSKYRSKNWLELVVDLVNEKFVIKDEMMATYLIEFAKPSQYFSKFDLSQILREKNEYADVLSKLTNIYEGDQYP